MKVLFLPNWQVHQLMQDSSAYQAPDKQIASNPYWFFKYFDTKPDVDIIDLQKGNWLSWIEKKLNFYIWQSIKAFFVAHRYDVVISHGAQSGLMFSLLKTITFRKQPKHIIFDIGAMNGGRNNPLELMFIRFALKSKPYIICHSKVIIEEYSQRFPDLKMRSTFIPFGVDVQDFMPMDLNGDLDQVGDYVLAFGTAKRDYATLVNAWQDAKKPFKLRVIGTIDHSINTELIEVIKKVSIQELKKQITQAKFVVIPLPVFNYSYGQMSFLQSMSLGKAVIVTKTPSSTDYLENQKGALLVDPYSIRSMKSALIDLLTDEALLNKLTEEARPYVLKNYSEEIMAKAVEQFILACLNAEHSEAI